MAGVYAVPVSPVVSVRIRPALLVSRSSYVAALGAAVQVIVGVTLPTVPVGPATTDLPGNAPRSVKVSAGSMC